MAIDWESVKAKYTSGMFTQREIGEEFGISHTAIQKRAKAEGWVIADKEQVVKAVKAVKAANAEVAKLPSVAKLPEVIDKLAKIEEKTQDLKLLVLEKATEQLKASNDLADTRTVAGVIKDLTPRDNSTNVAIQNNTQINQITVEFID